MRIDLHAHSTRSDGTTSPAEVVHAAAHCGLDVVALTDHDTIAGWDEASAAAREAGIALVRGIEVSCKHDGISVHLLAYLPADHGALYDELEKARISRETRAQRMVELLAHDIDLTWEDVQAHTGQGATIGRPHIADAMVARGVVADRSEAFSHYLSSNGKYHVSHYALDPVHAVELVLAAGGVPVMAHPFAAARGRVVDDSVVHSMIDAGLVGLEVNHRDHDATQRAHALQIATDRGLVVTGSSDFHGAGKPNQLGENTTDVQQFERLVEASSGATPVINVRRM